MAKKKSKKDKKRALDTENEINACVLSAMRSGLYRSVEQAKATVCNPETKQFPSSKARKKRLKKRKEEKESNK